jgi:hypothetical protein
LGHDDPRLCRRQLHGLSTTQQDDDASRGLIFSPDQRHRETAFGRSFCLVPELTRSVDIQVNERVSLRVRVDTLASSHRKLSPIRTHHGKAAGVILRMAASFSGVQVARHV